MTTKSEIIPAVSHVSSINRTDEKLWLPYNTLGTESVSTQPSSYQQTLSVLKWGIIIFGSIWLITRAQKAKHHIARAAKKASAATRKALEELEKE